MRQDNLLCLRRRSFVPVTTDSSHGWRVVPNLACRMVPTGLDQLWVADITYIRLQEEFAYLAIVLDAFSRRVIGWALATHLQASLATAAPAEFEAALHSQRGAQEGAVTTASRSLATALWRARSLAACCTSPATNRGPQLL
jgi:putative transposase